MAEPQDAPGGARAKRATTRKPKARPIAREAIAVAAERLGGVDRLVAWAKENEKNEQVFWATIYPKLIAVDIKVEAGKRLARALAWRPPT